MPLATTDIEFLRELVARHSGNVIAPRQVYMLERRLTPFAGMIGLENVESLVDQLRRSYDESLSRQVAEAVTINETSFFRDVHLYKALHQTVIPELIRAKSKQKELRIWSSACSSGQEPYSIAMVLQDHFPQIADWNLQIVATDLSEEMLRRSREGRYSQLEVNRGLPAKQLVRFFERKGPHWQAKTELRKMILHRRLNLVEPWPYLGQFDIVLLRNVLIYFDQDVKTDILKRVKGTLRPEGYLFVGSAETLLGLGVPYHRKEIDATICYRPTFV